MPQTQGQGRRCATTLKVDRAAWEASLARVAERTPGLVPVAKGNGYGFGIGNLAEAAAGLNCDTLAVGIPGEISAARERFSGDIVVLMPWPDFEPGEEGVIPTVSGAEQLRRLAGSGARVLVEVRTSMRRHGIGVDELAACGPLLDEVDFAGWTIHLPIGETGAEARELARAAVAIRPGPLWLSHVADEEAAAIAAELRQPVRVRRGTALWLADPATYRATSTVLDVHRVGKGERVGYRQRRVPAAGFVVVVSGGTANGIALEAPTAATTVRQRARALVGGGMAAYGRVLSPFTIAGRKRWFIEPPHMQSSLVFLPAGERPPAAGEQVDVTVRMTTFLPDAIVWD